MIVARAFRKLAGLIRARWHLRGARQAAIASSVWFGRRVKFASPANARITLGEKVRINAGCGIGITATDGEAPVLSIGADTYLQPRSRINVCKSVTVGCACAIAWDVDIMDSDFHAIVDTDGTDRAISKAVLIEDRVWIGVSAKILKGTFIGHDSVVAAGGVVSGSFPPFSLIAGVPARRVREIGGWRP